MTESALRKSGRSGNGVRRLHAVDHDGALGVEKPVEKDGHDHSKRGTMEIRRAQALARSVANPARTPHEGDDGRDED